MTLYMLDTDTCSFIIRRRPPSLRRRLSEIPPEEVCVSVVTRAELLYGLKRLPPAHPLHAEVRMILRSVRTVPWDSDAAEVYAEIRHQLVGTGQPIGELDMMIAAHAVAAGAVLVTNNTRHYERIAQPLTLENWNL